MAIRGRRQLFVVAVTLFAACSGGDAADTTVSSDAVVTTTETTDAPVATVSPPPPPATSAVTTSAPETSLPPPRFDIDSILAETPMIGLNVTPPMPAGADLPLPPGMADFDDVFSAAGTDRWATAREHVDVIKLHAWQVRHFLSDEQLIALFEYLDEHDLPLMFETEPLPPPDPAECEHTESFEGPYDLEMAQRISDLGGTISLVAIEEPYHFAHKLDTPGACQYPVERVVDEVIDYVTQMRSIFPDVPVGTIEPIWSSPATTPDDMAIWLDTYEARAGEPFAFLHLDPDWYWEPWADVAAGIESVADARGVPLGVLYNGGLEPDSESWMQRLMENASRLEEEYGVTPQHVLVQSWVDQPERALPDDDLAALTNGVVRYAGDRTSIEATVVDGSELSVSVTSSSGAPIPDATVAVEPRTLGAAFGTATLRGTVPGGATIAEILVRTNFEGAGPGPADVRISEIAYTEGDDPTNRVPNGDFDAGLDRWGLGGDPMGSAVIDGGGGDRWLDIDATAVEQVIVNGGGQAVTPSNPFELRVVYSITPDSVGSTLVAVEFPGLARNSLLLTSPSLATFEGLTDSDGTAEFDLTGFEPGPYEFVVSWRGDVARWPARAVLTSDVS